MKTVGLLVIAVVLIVATDARRLYSYGYTPRHIRMMPLKRQTRNSAMSRLRVIEIPAMSIKRKYVSPATSTNKRYAYSPARSLSALRGGRRLVRRFSPQPLHHCPTRAHSRDILAVIKAALSKINQNRREKLALKKVLGGSVQLCKKCVGGRCAFDHNSATATLSIAPACKSSRCRCGVEPHGKEATCSVTGWTKPHRPAYNVKVDCGQNGVIKPQNGTIEAPAKTVRPHVTKTKPVTTTEGTTTTTLPIVTLSQSDELDIVTDGKGSGYVTLFNTKNEETKPAPLLGEDEDVIGDEELLQ